MIFKLARYALWINGYSRIKSIYISGFKVLLSSLVDGILSVFLVKEVGCYSLIFYLVLELSSAQVREERLVWIRFIGVPIYLLEGECFWKFESLFGGVIMVDSNTIAQETYAFPWVKVFLSSLGVVGDDVSVVMENSCFLVTVREEGMKGVKQVFG